MKELLYSTTRKYNYQTKTSVEYINIECSFDIETTSTYTKDGKKFSFMYLWGFGLGENGDYLKYGRTWEEFIELLNYIANEMNVHINRRLVIYVHNLGYEFQFFRKLFKWESVFSVDYRKPIKAITTDGFEFRDSYILSGYNLETLAKNLVKHKNKKMVGNLDYSLIRHSETPITKQELKYMENDVTIILNYINEQLEQYENITKIPLTNTGRVREFVKNKCYNSEGKSKYKSSKSKRSNYRFIMENLTLEADEYLKLKRTFMGGFTHSNPLNTDKVLKDVYSIDFTSSYPSVMIAEKFPMGRGFTPTKSEILENGYDYYIENFCCVINISVQNLKNVFIYDSYLSESKCKIVGEKLINNGRVFSADYLNTYMTDVDYSIFKRCYEWDRIEIHDLICYPKGYLPKPIIESILELYQNKTTLKGVKGKEVEYLISKGMLNSIYGMTVTDIVKDEITYDEEWETKEVFLEAEITKYNEKKSRFLYYPWGVWVTAYARRNLWFGILSIKDDYIYSDTDSLKFFNYEKHKPFIDGYNKMVVAKQLKTLEYYELNPSLLSPKTVEGESKPLGVWDYEGHYTRFKTLGAKRYLYEEDEQLYLTVAGLSKMNGINYMVEKCNNDFSKVFDMFTDDLFIPSENTGKNTHTYVDYTITEPIEDYIGNKQNVTSLSGVHLEPTNFSLSISDYFVKFYKMLQSGYILKGDTKKSV